MNFTEAQAKGLVIGAVAGAGILASAAQLVEGKPPSIRTALGGAIAAAMLYALADWAPNVAGGLALVLLVGAVLTNGMDVASIINKSVGNG